MVYETQPISETLLTIPPKYIRDESQWARQICVWNKWRLCSMTGEIRDGEGNTLAESLDALTVALISLGWIIPREEGESRAGIAWHLIPAEAKTATAELIRAVKTTPSSSQE